MTTAGRRFDNRGEVSTKTITKVAMDFGRTATDGDLVLYMFGTPGQDRFGFRRATSLRARWVLWCWWIPVALMTASRRLTTSKIAASRL